MIRTLDDDCVEVSGGQHYTMCRGKSPHTTDAYMQSKQKAFPDTFDGSVLDIGGGLGFYSFLALARGASTATIVDVDEKVRTVGTNVLQHVHIDAHYADKCDYGCRTRDNVIALGIMHLLFICVELYSLDRVVQYLAQVTRKFLIVEWIEPDEKIIAKHLQDTAMQSVYSRALFEKSISKYFDVTGRHPTSKASRIIYTATKKEINK